ncbi:hypothetical protein HFP15_07195 [Amycolatopsis sp. K13G38]|uniref:Uncharacterized protein n=1 Tax=Amycolatopsis acididurans TaxID=2724524 RepID=A0ABX1IZ94_9PSEU|nr:hypothetical protein [Amycolatopsis acididurans]NKQ52664.1 hypothetical protein [Amycolatopsis acididurans]
MSAVWVLVAMLSCGVVAGLCWGPRLVELWGRVGAEPVESREHDAEP